jgi:hypothetical protein
MAEIHDLVYHGQGGFTYTEVYNMPIRYRQYHIKKINEYMKELEEARDKTQAPQKNPKEILSPNSKPQADFTSKAKATKK